ncbi:MAG: hypothetical protein ACXAEU_01560 [Candidatus Hodarchaeales archaeon]
MLTQLGTAKGTREFSLPDQLESTIGVFDAFLRGFATQPVNPVGNGQPGWLDPPRVIAFLFSRFFPIIAENFIKDHILVG